MALNLGQDLAVIGNIKLTDVELVAGHIEHYRPLLLQLVLLTKD